MLLPPATGLSRRRFNQGLVALAFAGLARQLHGAANNSSDVPGYGPLLPDPKGVLDLPAGFHYRVLSSLGQTMSDGFTVPDNADGMGCFALDDDRVVLVRNHELARKHLASSPSNKRVPMAYDRWREGQALPGGTTHLVYHLRSQQVEREFMSLAGTLRNCSGGVTPWGSWLTCEEAVDRASAELGQDHGYVFEVPATATGLVAPVPLKAMGRFLHEAVCIDPRSGIAYLTEDRGDSLLYRFIPHQRGNLAQGGRLQALAVKGQAQFDSRNWDKAHWAVGDALAVEWVDIEQPESPNDDLRLQGYQKGAALFARGEGIHWGEQELYFCCTNGGAKKLGQIMRYRPSPFEGTAQESQQPGQLALFVESQSPVSYNFGDNVAVAPNGHLIVCEDQYTDVVDNHLRGVTPTGELYTFARLRLQTELAGACFSPDGSVLFVNVYSPAMTLAIYKDGETKDANSP